MQHDQDKLNKDRTVGDLVVKVRKTFRHSMAGTDSLAAYTHERGARPRPPKYRHAAASCPPDPVHVSHDASVQAAKDELRAAERAGAAHRASQAAGGTIEMKKIKRIASTLSTV